MKHNGSHAAFLDLDISIGKVKFVYKMFDERDAFKFYIARIFRIMVLHSNLIEVLGV